VTVRAFLRFCVVAGALGLATGIWGRYSWGLESAMADVAVISIMAGGLLLLIIGVAGLLRTRLPDDPVLAARERVLDRSAWRAMLAGVAAGGLMVLFFWLTSRWTNLGNPVQSQIALVFGLLGAAIAILAERVTRWDLVVVPVLVLLGLLAFGNQIPFESQSMSRGVFIAFLCVLVLIALIVLNAPQIARGRRPAPEEE
jgi:hypothetical protein